MSVVEFSSTERAEPADKLDDTKPKLLSAL